MIIENNRTNFKDVIDNRNVVGRNIFTKNGKTMSPIKNTYEDSDKKPDEDSDKKPVEPVATGIRSLKGNDRLRRLQRLVNAERPYDHIPVERSRKHLHRYQNM